MSVVSIASIFGQPFWGNCCDRKKTIKKFLVVSLLVSSVTALLLPMLYNSIMLVVIICVVISFTENSMPSIIDSWTISSIGKKPWLDYGLTRGMGSLGYAITAVVFGMMLDRFGYGMMFYTHLILQFIAVGFCFFIDDISKLDSQQSCKTIHIKTIDIKAPKVTIKESGRFIWFLISTILVFAGFRATSTFYPLLLIQKGGGNGDLGMSLFIMSLSEVPVLLFSKKFLQKFKDTSIISISMFFFVIRILLHIVVPSISGLILIQAMQALSFALFLPASIYYINRIAPKGLNSTYLTIASSCYFGIGGIIGSMLGGVIIDKVGIYSLFGFSGVLAFCGMVIFMITSRVNDKSQ